MFVPTTKESQTIVNCLRVAAEKFDANAKLIREEGPPAYEVLAKTFDEQATEARRIANCVEEGATLAGADDRIEELIGSYFAMRRHGAGRLQVLAAIRETTGVDLAKSIPYTDSIPYTGGPRDRV